MNYLKHYHLLIEKADNRCILPNIYKEKHHILPLCLGGDNSSDNIISLFPEDHFVAHQLLSKIYYEHPGLIFACVRMTQSTKRMIRNNKLYSWIRLKNSELQRKARTGKKHSPETRKKISAASKRTWENPEYRKMMSERMSGENNPFYGKTHSPEFIQRVKEYNTLHFSGENNPMFGKTHTKEARERISPKNESPLTCPHCGQVGGSRIMKRWHFDKCLYNPYSDNNEHGRKTGKQKQLSCPHCGKIGGASAMKRYHFNNCKHSSHKE